jgi:hypothetical protein
LRIGVERSLKLLKKRESVFSQIAQFARARAAGFDGRVG